jgi:hypothetical protein
MASTFTLSIEPTGKPAYQHGFHLGTEETLARKIAEEIFTGRNAVGQFTCTVALLRDRRIVDIYDGTWQSDRAGRLYMECHGYDLDGNPLPT